MAVSAKNNVISLTKPKGLGSKVGKGLGSLARVSNQEEGSSSSGFRKIEGEFNSIKD